jgi:uncharacterized protein YeeX (DUF496 family)
VQSALVHQNQKNLIDNNTVVESDNTRQNNNDNLIEFLEKMVNNSKILWLMESLRTIDDMISRAKTDSTIDVEDLRKERRNCVMELKKLRK